ncbi:MAG: polysaccharide deacetylase [Gemmatimonadetes bacterium]|nr:polysaccharide deacetylase [Gemmatimonadota bacterium]
MTPRTSHTARSSRTVRLRLAGLALAAALPLACASLPLVGAKSLDVWGFTAPWDARSAASVRAHAGRMQGAVTGWIALDTATGQPLVVYRDTVARLASAPARMALVTSWMGDAFHPGTIRALGGDDARLAQSAASVASAVVNGGYRGVVLDFEEMLVADLPVTTRVVTAFASALRARGVKTVALAIPALDTAAFPARAFADVVDYEVVMLYDQHWGAGSPGAIAEPGWVRRALSMRAAEVGAGKLVAALPLYGYRWKTGAATEIIGYDDARRIAGEAGAQLDRDQATQTLHAMRPGQWELWVSDAGLVKALLDEVRSSGVGTVALWRLGLEDPSVWDVLR